MEDFDVEAMLEAPYNKNKSPKEEEIRYRNGSVERKEDRSHKRSSRTDDDDDDKYSRKRTNNNDGHNLSPRERSSKSHKRSGSVTDKDAPRKHRSRSRSETRDDRRDRKTSKDRDRKDRDRDRNRSREKDDKDRNHHRSRDKDDKDRDRHRSRDKDVKDRDRHRSRDKERNKDDERKKSRDPERRERDRDRERERSKQRSRSRDSRRVSRERPIRSRSRDHRPERSRFGARRSRSRDRPRSPPRVDKRISPIPERAVRGKSGRRSRSKEKVVPRRSISPRPFRRVRTPPNGIRGRSPLTDMSPEERDARTVFCMQLSQRVRARDLEEFFSSVGKVRDVRLITCNKTKRFKGIAYIEFRDPESVALALGLSGQLLLGIPISVQHTQAEKNRIATPPVFIPKKHTGPMRLYVGSLHFNITEEMLRGIFEPFGLIDSIQLIMDSDTGRSKGYGFITYHNADDAKKALEQLNGFELAGRPMKVGNVTERLDMNTASLDTDEMDRSGIDLGATGRLQLMFKLAEGAGLAVPQAAANALLATAPQPAPSIHTQTQSASIATQCFILSNMFDPRTETNPTWDGEIRDDVIEECSKHGGVLHIHVDKASLTGNVYVKCPSITTAVLAVNALHGRWFAGRVITAAYVPLLNYHSLFPDAIAAVNLLYTTRKPTDD